MVDYKVTELDDTIDFGNLSYWDVVIIGAGPGGLAASLTTAHRGLTTLVIEAKDKAGGQPQFLYADKNIVDVPGFPDGIRGDELSNRVYRQATNALVQFRFQEELVTIEDTDQVEKDDKLKRVVTTREEYFCRKVILACGLLHYPRKLPVLDLLESKKVFYKIPKIGDYEGHGVVIVGGGDSAFDAAVMAIERGASVDVLCREEPIAKSDTVARVISSGGRVHVPSEIAAAAHEGDSIRLTLTNDAELRADYVIVQIGFLSAKETFERLKLRLNEDGSIAIDPYFETSRHGLFAIGDVHGDIKLITVAWAEGIQAAIYAFKEITSPYWLNEKRLRDQKIAMIGEKITEAAQGTGKRGLIPESGSGSHRSVGYSIYMLSDNHLSPEHEAFVAAGQGGPVFFDGSDGKYVVMRTDVYDAMLGVGDESLAATLAAVREGIADVAAGRSQDADEFFDKLARKYES